MKPKILGNTLAVAAITATLLTAYALGSRTAATALTQPREDGRRWALPPKAAALDMAADISRLALELRVRPDAELQSS